MATRTAFLMRSLHVFPILLSVICLRAAAEAQHGGGGGHSRGGHFGWLHVGFGKHSGPHAKFEAPSPSSSPRPPSHLPTPGLMPFRPRISPTLLWSPSLFPHTPASEFLSFLLMCAPIITISSATTSRVLLRPDASSTARPRSASSNHFCRCFPSPVTSIFLIQASASGGTRLTSATDLKNSRNRKCPRSRPLSIHRMTMQHTGIPHCVPEPDSGQQPKTESLARESSCWC